MPSTRDFLKAARKLINNPEHWTQGASARDAADFSVSATSKRAVCWCAYGAVHKTAGAKRLDRVLNALASQLSESDERNGDVSTFNDRNDHRDVIKLFDRAIKAAK